MRLFTIFFLSLVLQLTGSFSQAMSQHLEKNIHHVLKRFKQNINIGIVVRNANNGKLYYQRNGNRLFTPASNMKIITAITGLMVLGSNYTYQTKLLIPNKGMSKHTLRGNLVLQFHGDPSLRSFNIFTLIGMLAHYKINTIHGNIIIDDSHYNGKSLGKGWMWDDLQHCYSAPVGAAILDHNCIAVTVNPAKKDSEFATLIPSALSEFTPITNHVLTRTKKKRCHIGILTNKRNQYILSGCIKKNSKPQLINIAITNPIAYIKKSIKKALKYYNIHLKGTIQEGIAAKNMRLLAVHKSEAFPILLDKMMKESDDLYAETFLKSIGATYFKRAGNWQLGTKALTIILKKKMHVNLHHIELIDGSGLSRYNLITPLTLDKILQYAFHHFAIKSQFIASLPIAGVDGTLKHRMLWDKKKQNIKAKTGSMRSVSALSGYVHSKHHGVLSFVIIINGFKKRIRYYRKLEDRICKVLVNF